MEILAAVLIILGVIGSVLPLLPGPPLSFIGLFLYAFQTKFVGVETTHLLIFGALSFISILLDYFGPILGAKKNKSSKSGVTGAVIGSIVGIFSMGPFGLFLGPLIGGFIGEYLEKKDFRIAMKTAWGAFSGFLLSTVFRLLVSVSIAVYFFAALF